MTKDQQLYQKIVHEAWNSEDFKQELLQNPIAAIEKLTGETVNIPEGKSLVIHDQTDQEQHVFMTIPPNTGINDLELDEEQLEAVSGGMALGLPAPPKIWDPVASVQPPDLDLISQ